MDKQKEIRFLFHELSNKLNIILLKTGYRALQAQSENDPAITREDLLKKLIELQNDFKKLEAETIETSKIFKDLKQKTYGALGIVLNSKSKPSKKA